MTTSLVKSGSDLVQPGTGEVVGQVPSFSMVEYIASVTTPASLEAQKKLASAYDKACDSLIGENDVQKEGGRTFKKKSAWAKLGRHFNISTVVVSAQKEMLGEVFCATVTVKASAPWGQSAEAVGACATDEESGRRSITIADAIATAETRAHNRAISRLIAMGEVSAEEMQKEQRSGVKGGRGDATQTGQYNAPAPDQGHTATPSTSKDAADKLMPFGKQATKRLGEIASGDLQTTVEWCRKTDSKKFAALISACESVIASREVLVGAGNFDDFPAALQDTDDDLPF